MALSDQYPDIYNAWVAAGGVDDNFRAHLLALAGDNVIPTAEDLVWLAGHTNNGFAQLQDANAKYGVKSGIKTSVVIIGQPG